MTDTLLASSASLLSSEAPLLVTQAVPSGRGLPLALDPLIRTYRKGRGYGHAVGPALLRGQQGKSSIVVGVPVERVSMVEVSTRPLLTGTHLITGLEGESAVVAAALRACAEVVLERVVDLRDVRASALEIRVRRRTDVRAGSGQGSASAEAAGAVRALSSAWGVELGPEEISRLVAQAHREGGAGVFSGGVWPGIVALDENRGDLVGQAQWWPRLALVIITPEKGVAGKGGSPVRLDARATRGVLEDLGRAAEARNSMDFLRVSTGVAERALRGDRVREELGELVRDRARRVGADGMIGADPSVGLALAFCAEQDGRNRAFAACRELRESLGAGLRTSTTITRPAPLRD